MMRSPLRSILAFCMLTTGSCLLLPGGALADDGTSGSNEAQVRPARMAADARPIRIRVSGHIGLTSFAASQSLDAVLRTSSGPTYGGGAGVLIGRHLFLDVQVSRFDHSGSRVFIGPGNLRFDLGIPLDVTVMPIDVSAGWRFPLGGRWSRYVRSSPRAVPFAGGGVGVVKYDETSRFAKPGEDVGSTFTSYHALGGVEIPIWRGFGVIGEGVYRWVRNALGASGVSAAFRETDLGGLSVRVRAAFTF